MRGLMAAGILLLLVGCHSTTACRGRPPHRDPRTGDLTCGPRTRTVYLGDVQSSGGYQSSHPPSRPRTRHPGSEDHRCTFLGELGDALASDSAKGDCYCDCRYDGGPVFDCKRLCGFY